MGSLVVVLLVALAVGSAWAARSSSLQLQRIERQQEHAARAERDRVEALARSLLTSLPDGVPVIADQLRPSREASLPGLRAACDHAGSDPDRRLRAAVALSLLDEDRSADLIAAIPTAPASESRNLLLALTCAGRRGIGPLRDGFREARSPEVRTRFAIALLAFGEFDAALRDARPRPRPGRSLGVHPRVRRMARRPRGAVRAAAPPRRPRPTQRPLHGAGRVDPKRQTEAEIAVLVSTLRQLHVECPDGGTHSAAGWALRRWGIEPPAVAPSRTAPPGRGWFVNGLGMTMIEVPPGAFPTRQSYMLPYALSACEVTVGQFRRFLDDPDRSRSGRPDGSPPPALGTDDGPGSDLPRNMVSWEDAVRFCNWLSRAEGLRPCYDRPGGETGDWRCRFEADGYRLPTRAEWEYATRAGSSTTYPMGSTARFLDEYVNFGLDRPAPTAQRAPNRWGFFDLQGNLWELIWESGSEFPAAWLHPVGAVTGAVRQTIGGSFDGGTYHLNYGSPSPLGARDPSYSRGFRIACRGGGESDRLLFQAIGSDDPAGALRQAVRLAPAVAAPHLMLSHAENEAGNLPAALAEAGAATRLDAGDARAWAWRGWLSLEAGLPGAALESLRTAIRREPDREEAYSHLAVALSQADDPHEVLAVAAELDGIASDRPAIASLEEEVARMIVSAPGSSPDLVARAIRLARSAAAGSPENWAYHHTMGVALYRAGDWPGATDELERSIRLQDGDAGYGHDGFVLAMARWRRGDEQRGLLVYDRSVAWMERDAPDDAGVRRLRAEAEAVLDTARPRPDFRAVLGGLRPSNVGRSTIGDRTMRITVVGERRCATWDGPSPRARARSGPPAGAPTSSTPGSAGPRCPVSSSPGRDMTGTVARSSNDSGT